MQDYLAMAEWRLEMSLSFRAEPGDPRGAEHPAQPRNLAFLGSDPNFSALKQSLWGGAALQRCDKAPIPLTRFSA
jgi:hypothetical protein